MSTTIDRILAQQDMRSLGIAASAQSPESVQSHHSRLEIEAGEIVKVSEQSAVAMNSERDEAGFAELKELSKSIVWR